jgi:hydroxyacylglutathione hydrolase
MKRIYSLSFLLCLYFIPVFSQAVRQNEPSSWFTSVSMTKNVMRISDHGADNIYLVMGTQKAMLIDNGLGSANIRDYVKTLTRLPVIVVITHGHPDHAGGNYQFKEVNIHPDDMASATVYNNLPKKSGGAAGMMTGGAKVPDNDVFKDTLNHQPTRMIPLHDGQVFDLGGRKLEVIYTPGHTVGEICLLDKENRMIIHWCGFTFPGPSLWKYTCSRLKS